LQSTPRLEALEDRTLPSFAVPAAFGLAAAPQAVATGHFEGNSAPLDVVSANADGTLSVFLGQGNGTLQNPITLHVGGSPTAVAVGDLLGNGVQDVVTANSNGTVNVVLSNGNGTFAAPTSFAVGATPVGLALADFNGDGKLDVVTANGNGTLSFLAGNGHGGFAAPVTAATASDTFTSVAVGDFNRDGKADVVAGTTTGLDVLLGNGNGTFTLKQTVSFARTIDGFVFNNGVSSVAVGNFQGHGNEDVVADSAGGLSILLGNGNGTVGSRVGLNAGPVGSFVIGDFTGDGKQDIVTSNVAGYATPPSISLLAGNGNGTFAATVTQDASVAANGLAAGDFNGDGKLDLAYASATGGNIVGTLLNAGGGTFAMTPAVATSVAPTALAAADFTGNGRQDLVVMGEFNDLQVLLSNGDGTFRAGPTLSDSAGPLAVTVGDFTGNGKQDIAVGNFDGSIDVFLGNGNGTFQAPKVFNIGSNNIVQSLVTGDFNHDGKADLAVTTNATTTGGASQVVVLLSNGNGTFRKSAAVNVGTDAEGLAAADFNGDGNLDLVTTDFLPGGLRDVEVLLGNGNGTFKAPVVTPTGFSPTSVAVGDFNGDGKADLVLVDYFSVDNVVLVMTSNGNGTFNKPLVTKFTAQLGISAPVVGDFFGDGKQSVAVSTGVGSVTVLRGNGDGTFQAPNVSLAGSHGTQPSGLVAGDFLGNGKLDLASSNLSTGDVSVLVNNSPKPVVGSNATTTTLSTDVNPAVSGQPTLLTATVTSSGGTPTGTVNFFDGSTLLGQAAVDPNGHASLLVALGAGNHALKAVFAGTTPFTASTSAVLTETVHKDATTITLGVSHLGGSFFEAVVNLTPNAPGGGVPTGTITIFDGTTVLTTVPASEAQFLVRLGAGKHSLTASYSGDANFLASVSAPLVFTT
jgi:hypothetical protein